ncbi:TetR/AcrR family transcriptional regulator [Streptomyces albipurpureus]|uniref:TetR/AcrR family transcriptional regulator n=1 Tax=Streptomyces albipurpureus TaxID=2897419 RepID=A0ABT0USP6_9ACTN|nr:TetR/AcrR family transcriptional regulator C-terminal domain-containing protein [Streptomyces sp. CWNU-1]MCM2391382.1 TetR/AcrR family transcriptional regulator [Streptomyces sp. CWNU-1]
MSMSSEPPARRRPTHRKGRATLTRESIGRAALDFLGRRGPAELTMRSLATDLGVSPRAIYNYVEDRRDLITVAAEIFEADWQPPQLVPTPDRWRTDLRAYCADLRAHYRRHPGMTSLALRENITLARHPTMLRNVDALIGFYATVGLPLPDAYRACMETIRLVVGFVEFQDSLHDHPPAHLDPAEHSQPLPSWLQPDGPGGDLPHLTRLQEDTRQPDSPDTLFAFSVQILIDGIGARVAGGEF